MKKKYDILLFSSFSILLMTGNLFFLPKAFPNNIKTNLKQAKPICYVQNNNGELVDLTNICGKASITNNYIPDQKSNLNTSNQSPDPNINIPNQYPDPNLNFNSDSFPKELLPNVQTNE
jgi:hypothetical protein